MKKLLSILLIIVISLSSICCVTIPSYAEENASINIDDVPRDWTGEYNGYGSKGSIYRSMDMHISNIEPDGSIIK